MRMEMCSPGMRLLARKSMFFDLNVNENQIFMRKLVCTVGMQHLSFVRTVQNRVAECAMYRLTLDRSCADTAQML